MRKVLVSMLAAAAMYTIFTGCEQGNEIPTTNAVTTSVSVTTAAAEVITTTQASSADAPSAGDNAAQTTAASAKTTTAAASATTTVRAAAPAAPQATEPGIADLSDDALLQLGAKLYQKAGEVTWDYYTGLGPFALEGGESPVGQMIDDKRYGYRITDPAAQSIKDVKAAYHKIFSDRYTEDLDQVFLEKNGKLYRCAGDRGANIFYTDTKLQKIIRKTDDEVYFTAVSHYADPDTGEKQPSETATFSIVYQNGVWLIGQYTLPF